MAEQIDYGRSDAEIEAGKRGVAEADQRMIALILAQNTTPETDTYEYRLDEVGDDPRVLATIFEMQAQGFNMQPALEYPVGENTQNI